MNGVRRYYDPKTGKVVTGWIESSGYRYYSDASTGKRVGETTMRSIRYLLDSKYGYQHLGFCTFSDSTVSYYKEDGSIVSGWLKTGGKSYYFDSNYRMKTGWQTISGKKYYFATSGTMCTGWKTIGGNRYYFQPSGVLLTDTVKDGYRIGTDGVAVKIVCAKADAVLNEIGCDLKAAFN
ncbi:MAG: hypothetical protein LUC50_01725 [Ruminococcus sp.]|nr:hypothetical protein [Ruminococcus sp.]